MLIIMTVFRIVVVGEGREKFGHVFLADTGTSNGDITGQTRPINTVDFKVSDLIVCVNCTDYQHVSVLSPADLSAS